jgi:hypothetical protein
MVKYIHKIELRLTPDLSLFPRGMRRSDLKNIECGSFSVQVLARLDAWQTTRGKVEMENHESGLKRVFPNIQHRQLDW